MYSQQHQRGSQPKENRYHTGSEGRETIQRCFGNQHGIKDEVTLLERNYHVR